MRYVMIGGGLATARATEAVRTSRFEGDVVLVGAERELPNDRPPLSSTWREWVNATPSSSTSPASIQTPESQSSWDMPR